MASETNSAALSAAAGAGWVLSALCLADAALLAWMITL